MSRHRDVRCMKYSDEYDGYDDVYGHSVEDDYCVSPGAEQFMYDRNKQANISSFITEPNIVEGDEEELEEQPESYKAPSLSELETAKLMSCIDTIRNVVGDSITESELKKRIIELDYNTEAVLDAILNSASSKKAEEQTPNKRLADFPLGLSLNKTALGSKTELPAFTIPKLSFNKKSNLDEDVAKNNISLSPLSSLKSLKSLSSSNTVNTNSKILQPSSLSALIDTHKKSNLTDSVSKTPQPTSPSFSSLSDLTSHHLKKSGSPSLARLSLNTRKENQSFPSTLSNLKSAFSNQNVNIITKDVSSLQLHEEQDNKCDRVNSQKNDEMQVDIEPLKSSKLKVLEPKNSQNTSNLTISNCNLSNLRNSQTKYFRKSASSFGKVLCRRLKTKSPLEKQKSWYFQTSPNITRFDFSEMSPDSKILQYLRKKI